VTVRDLRCDVCGRAISGPVGVSLPGAGGVRFSYHPGDLLLRDDSGLVCERCWADLWHGTTAQWRQCAVCGEQVGHAESLHVRRVDEPDTRQLCARDAVNFLNRLRTVEPKLDPGTFRFPG
jgi:hypothetical protein